MNRPADHCHWSSSQQRNFSSRHLAEDLHRPGKPGFCRVGHDTIALDADVQLRVLDHREVIGDGRRKIEYLQEYAW